MIRVLFVCLGNICRSPMAEAVFRDLVMRKGLSSHFFIDSAGTGDWHVGNPPHKGTQDILTHYDISYDGIQARTIRNQDLLEFEYIVAMDAENIGTIRRMAGYSKTGQIARLLDYVSTIGEDDVPDPYYSGNFEFVFQLVQQGCEGLLHTIMKEHHLTGGNGNE